MAAPEEIIASPLTLYLAPVTTAFPAVEALPADFDAAWEKVGVAGARNYDEEGVTVSHSEEVYDFKPAGATMPAKRFRTGESLEIKLNLVDLSPATYAKMMNDAPITTGAHEKSFSLFRGDQVNSFAVLARGVSPVDNDMNMQYEIPIAFLSVNGDAQFNKGKPVMLPLSLLAVIHQDADAPICRIQTSES